MSAFTARFKIDGLPKLKRRMRMHKVAGLPIRNFLRDYGQEVVKEAKAVAPKDSGRLRRSIKMQPVLDLGRLPDGITIRSMAQHSSYVHGTGPNFKLTEPYARSKPHWPPAKPLQAWGPVKSGQIPVFLVQKAIAEKGTPLIPYLNIGVKNSRGKRKLLLKKAAVEIELLWKAGRKLK
tara:strand:- start:54 stop:587 length:534 start_codon:yes stop_codon:yes gene_type:complete